MKTCALCLEEKKLCNSHIVPEFIFKRLKEGEGCFHVYRESAKGFTTFGRTFTEKLLCQECESLFSKWETYASLFFSDQIQLSGKPKGNHLVLSGVDYEKLKLFYMSLLWRFSITRNPWLKGHDLGPHKEKLRKLLIASDPAEPWRYGCTIIAVKVDDEHVPDLLVPPTKAKIDGHWFTRLVINGFILAYITSSHPPDKRLQSMFLQRDGSFLFVRNELFDIPFLSGIALSAATHDKNILWIASVQSTHQQPHTFSRIVPFKPQKQHLQWIIQNDKKNVMYSDKQYTSFTMIPFIRNFL